MFSSSVADIYICSKTSNELTWMEIKKNKLKEKTNF
jgi:hypothetical protein